MESTPTERVRVYEPEPDRPARAEPLLSGVLAKVSGRVLRGTLLYPFVFAAGVLLLWWGWLGIAGPVLALLISAWCWRTYARTYFFAHRPLRTLLDGAFWELRPAQDGILVAGAKVSLRLPGTGEPRWLVLPTSSATRIQLAALRRVWVLGPSRSGRAYVVLPGAVLGLMGRVGPTPAKGSVELPARPLVPCWPNQDPVLVAFLDRVGAAKRGAALIVAVAALFFVAMAVEQYFRGPLVTAVPATLALLCLVVARGALRSAAAIRKAPEATGWTELIAEIDGEVEFLPSGAAAARGRATLPDGRPVAFTANTIGVDLLANIVATGRLWVMGAPQPGSVVRVGLPGYPVYAALTLTA